MNRDRAKGFGIYQEKRRVYREASVLPKIIGTSFALPRTREGIMESWRVVNEDTEQAIIDSNDPSLLSGYVLRQLLIEYAEHFTDAEIKKAAFFIPQLEALVGIDKLTQTWNRRVFARDLDRSMKQLDRERVRGEKVTETVVAVIDIDHFKDINSLGGLPAGDLVLQQLVRFAQRVFRRATDTVYRYGGEEFIVMMRNTPQQEALRLLEAFRRIVETQLLSTVLERLSAGEAKIQLSQKDAITVSIGYAASQPNDRPLHLFLRADTALYAAKKGTRTASVGRNQTQMFDRDIAGQHPEKKKKMPIKPTGQVAAEMSSDQLPALITESNENIYARYQLSDERSEQSGIVVSSDPRKGMEALFARLAQRVGVDTLSRYNTFQVVDGALKYIEANAYKDALTALPNRRSFDEIDRPRMWSEMQRQGHKYVYVVADIDKFKSINDTFGHAVGDVVLRAVGQLLSKHVRKNDAMARYGGEEFAFLIEVQDDQELHKALNRLSRIVEKELIKVTQQAMRKQGISITFDRNAITMSFGAVYIDPAPQLTEDDRLIYRVPEIHVVHTQATEALSYAKAVPGTEDPEQAGYLTSRSGNIGRNRWVLKKS